MRDTPPAINQPIIDLYDHYTHAPLDRREFIRRLASLVGSTAAAYALLPILENNYAQAALTPESDDRYLAGMVEFDGSNGKLKAYRVRPATLDQPRGAVLIIHENRGLNPHIRDVARRVAVAGFIALAIDHLSTFGGTPDNEDAARALFAKLDGAQVIANNRAALAYLSAMPDCNGKLGAIGFCWGGASVNQLAVHAPELSAAVSFYGMAPDLALVPAIKSPLLLHYAGLDERINASRAGYEAALKANNITFESHLYEGKQHGFHNDSNAARYDQAAAELAWQRSVEFLKRVL